MPRSIVRSAALLPFLIAAAGGAGCYEYRANALGVTPATEGTKPGGDVVWSVAWGLAKQEPKIDCNEQPLDEVTVRDNFGFTLITVLTLGFLSPKKIEWRCAPPRPSDGVIRDAGPGR